MRTGLDGDGHSVYKWIVHLEAPMKSLSLSEARRTLPSLADEVAERGEEIIVTRRGKPVLRLVPVVPEPPAMTLRGLPILISADFDDPVEQDWEALT